MTNVKTKDGTVTLILDEKRIKLIVANSEVGVSLLNLTPVKARQLVKSLAKLADKIKGVEGWTIRPALKAAGLHVGFGHPGPSLDGREW